MTGRSFFVLTLFIFKARIICWPATFFFLQTETFSFLTAVSEVSIWNWSCQWVKVCELVPRYVNTRPTSQSGSLQDWLYCLTRSCLTILGLVSIAHYCCIHTRVTSGPYRPGTCTHGDNGHSVIIRVAIDANMWHVSVHYARWPNLFVFNETRLQPTFADTIASLQSSRKFSRISFVRCCESSRRISITLGPVTFPSSTIRSLCFVRVHAHTQTYCDIHTHAHCHAWTKTQNTLWTHIRNRASNSGITKT